MNIFSMRALATTLKVIGAIAAVPSICGIVLFGVHAMGRRLARPPTGDMNVGSNPDAILLILKGIAKAFGVLGRIGGAVEGFVVSVLAALAAFGLVFGVACWFIGRGLHSEASWARISAFVLIVLAIVPAMLFALSANNIGRAVLFGVVVLCGIALYTLWNGYAPQTP